MTVKQAEQLAEQTLTIMRSRAVDAVRYAEAYGHEGRTCVVDGSMYSPSTRALPNASRAWEAGDDAWTAFDEIVGDGVEQITVPEDTDSDAPDDWSLSWDEGCLFAYAPGFEHTD